MLWVAAPVPLWVARDPPCSLVNCQVQYPAFLVTGCQGPYRCTGHPPVLIRFSRHPGCKVLEPLFNLNSSAFVQPSSAVLTFKRVIVSRGFLPALKNVTPPPKKVVNLKICRLVGKILNSTVDCIAWRTHWHLLCYLVFWFILLDCLPLPFFFLKKKIKK